MAVGAETLGTEVVAPPVTATRGDRFRKPQRSTRALALSYLVTVFLLITLNFFLPRAMPGDPISALTTEGTPAYVSDAAMRAKLESYYGLDRPLLAQYGKYLWGLAHGDLGVSIRYRVAVTQLVKERLPWTLLLVSSAMAITVLVGWSAGIHAAWRRGRGADRGLMAALLTLHSFPTFFVGSLAVLVFSVKLGWFPLAGARTLFSRFSSPWRWGWFVDVGHHLMLPAAVLAVSFAAAHYMTMRASMVGELGADYLLLGRAKGLRARRLKYGYAARNALLPVVTLAALTFAMAITTETVVVETLFAYQGIGRLTTQAIAYRDYPTLGGCFLVISLVVVTSNFLADLACRHLDPRTTG